MACMQISNGYEVLTYHRRRFPSRDLAASDLTPCFLWIFLGGPYIEKLRGNEPLSTALSAVTAAVVGVVLHLAVWFGLHVIFKTLLSGGR
jgi:Chromate transporter